MTFSQYQYLLKLHQEALSHKPSSSVYDSFNPDEHFFNLIDSEFQRFLYSLLPESERPSVDEDIGID